MYVQVVGTKHALEEFRVGVTVVMLAAKQHILQGNLKHKDLTGQEVSSQVCPLNLSLHNYWLICKWLTNWLCHVHAWICHGLACSEQVAHLELLQH